MPYPRPDLPSPSPSAERGLDLPGVRLGVVHLIAVGILVTVGIFAAAGLLLGRISHAVDLLVERDLSNTRRIAEIRLYDEVLTMSARLAAASGERQWIDRYFAFEPKLTQAIEASRLLAPDAYAAAATADTSAANDALIALETEAFQLVEAGQSEQAYKLLSSPAYLQNKAVYAAGMERTEAAITRSVQASTQSLAQLLDGSRLIAWVALLVLAGAWSLLLMIARRLLEARRQAEIELGAARDRAEAAMHAKARFLANMSHEIRTPLNGVIGMNELLCSTPLDDNQQQYVQNIRSSSEALLHVIDDVLDYSKIDAGRLEFERIEFDLMSKLEDVAALIAPRTASRGVELLVAFRPGVPEHLMGDPGRLGQILLNLLGNAAKFTSEGEVRLEVRLAAGSVEQPLPNDQRQWLEFEVSDTGIGIPADRLPALFSPFEQVDASTTRRFGGTGLGLAITRRLVDLMGGSVSLRSALGVGTQFLVRLPFGRVAGPVRSGALQPVAPGQRVWIADDHPEALAILGGQLEGLGCEVTRFVDGTSLLAAIRAQAAGARPELIMLDYRMPGLDGVQTARQLRAQAGCERIPLVLFSADPRGVGSDEPSIDARLLKPIRRLELERTLARLCQPGAGTAPRPALQAADGGVPQSLRGLYVLLVEDNPINQRVVQALLERAGVRVRVASDGLAACEAEARERFDAVLMDCQMPVLDGYEATQRIRAQARAAGRRPTLILALTAHVLDGERQRCLAAGMDGYLTKPIRSRELYAALEQHLPLAPEAGAPRPYAA